MSIDRRKFFKAMAAGGVAYAMGRTLGTGFSQMTGLRGPSGGDGCVHENHGVEHCLGVRYP